MNGVPAGRESATALEGFLEVAGGVLASAYGRQFSKLLQLAYTTFLPALESCGDAAARPVAVRLRVALQSGEYTRPHPKRTLPASDLSSDASSFA